MSNYVVLIRARSVIAGITTLFVETEIIFTIFNSGNEAFSIFFSYAGLLFFSIQLWSSSLCFAQNL